MKDTTRSRALYCIREFEQINGIAFDPFDSYHRQIVRGMGPYSVTHWRMRRHFARMTAPAILAEIERLTK